MNGTILNPASLDLPCPTARRRRAKKCAVIAWLVVPHLLVGPLLGFAEPDETHHPPATIQVSGLGLLQNRQAKRMLQEIRTDKEAPTLTPNFVEDAFLVLRNRVVNDGYLKPVLTAELDLADSRTLSYWWDGEAELDVPRDIEITAARFRVLRGTLYYYDEFEAEGLLEASRKQKSEGFFVRTDTLLRLKSSRRFSPSRFNTSLNNLRRDLENDGYRDATIEVIDQAIDPETGRVKIRVLVNAGPRHIVRSLKVRSSEGEKPVSVELMAVPPGQPFSLAWQQDMAQEISKRHFAEGYPDTRTRIREAGREAAGNEVHLDLVAEVTRGEQVKLGRVRFVGAKKTNPRFLNRKARLEGPLLNRLEVDRNRDRLSKLGIFKFVDVKLEPTVGPERDVVFDLTEGKRFNINLLGGYGSYDQLFGGIEFEHFNLWNISHKTRLRLVQSMKSTQLTYTYTIPEFFTRDLGLFAAADGFQREELTFDRQELKLSIGTRKQFERSGQQLGVRYAYQFLNAENLSGSLSPTEGVTEAGAVIADWQLERRDNPLLPKNGYRFYGNVEVANQALGGRSDYQRLEFGAAYHRPLGRGLYLHVGLRHDVALSHDPAELLPFNKRFFPGGENSVRGYQRGGASPLAPDGSQVGAVSSLQGNLELEQYLTGSISIVAFLDGVGVTPVIDNYPFDEVLTSVGGGIRWNTVIGPVRVEYGYNLNRREPDPSGTLQFSIGYPF